MIETVTLVFLFSGEPTAREAGLLSGYADRHSIRLVPPTAAPTSPRLAYDDELVRRIEARLDEAQTLAASLDEERALRLLDEIERELERHPELPQVAWLLAERHVSAARIVRRNPDGEAEAQALEARARALEGERAASFGEPATAPATDRDALVAIRITDLEPGDLLEVDGSAGPAERRLVPGHHHARVLRNDRLVWAGFFEVQAPDEQLRALGIPNIAACSSDDFVRLGPAAAPPYGAVGVRCANWLAVRRTPAGLEVARCTAERCARPEPLLFPRPVAREPGAGAGLPDWAKIALIGAGTVGAGTLLLLATGSLDRDEPPPVLVYRFGGIR